jgi:hypothetical protein
MTVSAIPYIGVGTTLGYKIGSATVYTPLALLQDDFDLGPLENAVVEIKTLASGETTKVFGRSNSGSLTGTMYLVNGDAGVTQMFALKASKQVVLWQVQVPDGSGENPITTGTTYDFSAGVASVTLQGFSGEDSPVLAFELAVSGAVTETVGS